MLFGGRWVTYVCTFSVAGNYTAYEKARGDKETNVARTQENVNKKRAQLEESIRKMQIAATRDVSGKGSGQVASRKKKLARHGVEKNEHGHRFRAQRDSYEGMSSIRAGSMNGMDAYIPM
jgi:ATPase subunit of ABC transporter with duplicated ATPase domains